MFVSRSIHDIDLFVGLNLEDTLPGALVGPTTSCILKKQFDALKFGDRFFYSHASNPNINSTIVENCFFIE